MEKEVLKQFGSKIRSLRIRKGWSRQDLAQRSGLTLSAIGSIETGKKDVRLERAWRIARTLGRPLGQLLKGLGLSKARLKRFRRS